MFIVVGSTFCGLLYFCLYYGKYYCLAIIITSFDDRLFHLKKMRATSSLLNEIIISIRLFENDIFIFFFAR